MARGLRTQALVALALGAAGNWHPAGAAEYRCWNGNLVRRIELSRADTAEGAGCEVRYWRNAEAPGAGQSLWRATRDTDFCAARARELIARLEAGGWTCSSSAQPASGAPMQAARSDPELAPRTEPPMATAAPAQIGRSPEPEPAEETLPASPPSPVVSPPAPSSLPAEPASPVVARTEPSATDDPVTASPANSHAALLDPIVEQTIHSLQELYGDHFQAELAAFGNLDDDGLQDAAVLITYQADRNEYVQYLVAYLFNGETFQSVATRNVGSRSLDALRADVQGIAGGKILVELEALGGDATCCVRRRTAFALANGQLVEVDHPGAAGLERTSGAKTPGASVEGQRARPTVGPNAPIEQPGRPQDTLATVTLQRKPDPVLPDEFALLPLESLEVLERLTAERASRPRPVADAPSMTRLQSAMGALPSRAQEPRTVRIQPSRSSPQVGAELATLGSAARLHVAGEASTIDDRSALAAGDIRVFIHHIANHQGDAALAQRLADHLRRQGFTVAEIRPVDLNIGTPSVRYFFERDRAASQRLVEELGRFFEEGTSLAPDHPSDFTHYLPKPRPGNVEVWLQAS